MNTKYLKQFEKYYNGEMDPAEKAAFEEALSKSAEMNLSFREYMSIYEALGDKDMLDLRVKLKEIREERNRAREGDFLLRNYNWLWVAALVAVILGISVVTSIIVTKTENLKQHASEWKLAEMDSYSELNRELMQYEQRDHNFVLISPEDPVFINRFAPLKFEWTVDSSDPLFLELINWRGVVIYTSPKPVSSPYFVNGELPPGLMAFRFRTKTASYKIGLLFLK